MVIIIMHLLFKDFVAPLPNEAVELCRGSI